MAGGSDWILASRRVSAVLERISAKAGPNDENLFSLGNDIAGEMRLTCPGFDGRGSL